MRIMQVVTSIILAGSGLSGTFAQRVSSVELKSAKTAVEDGKEQGGRLSAVVQRVHSLAELAASFRDDDSRLRTLIFLADVLWKKGNDQDYARQLFLKTYELLKTFVARVKRAPDSGDPRGAEAVESARRARSAQTLRLLLIEYVARHDTTLALRISGDDSLIVKGATDRSGYDHLNIANSLISEGNYPAAAKFTRQAVGETIIDKGHLLGVAQALLNLRKGDKASADELFATALSNLVAQPGIGINDLLIFGSYIFTSSALPAGVPPDQIIITPVRVGNVSLAADITADRANISQPLVRVFLLSVLRMKQRQMNSVEAQHYAAACSLLVPKAQRYAADLSAEFSDLAAGAGLVAPRAEPSGPSSFYELAGEPQSLQTALHKLDEMKDQGSRDEYCLLLVRAFYVRADLKSAMLIAEKVSDTATRQKLVEVISFRESVKYIEDGDLDAAEKAVQGTSSNSKRALLSLGIAQAALEKKDTFRARANLNATLKQLRGNANTSQNARLILAAAETFAEFDPVVAAEVLDEAVRAFNRIGYGIPNGDPIQAAVKITVGRRTATFDTRVRTARQGSFYEVLKPLIGADFERAWGTVLSLKTEQVLVLAIPALASAVLDQEFKKPVKVSEAKR